MSTRIFIIEDEAIHREAIKIAIEEAGFELCGECGDADTAFERIREASPDVLLADIALPGVNNGISLAAKVHAELAIPHIFTTSMTSDEVMQEAALTRPAAYLTKPVDIDDLRAAVRIALVKQDNAKGSDKQDDSLVIQQTDAIFVKVGDRLVRVRVKDILLITSDGDNYISVVTEAKSLSCRGTLKDIASQLPPSFVKVHRGYIINIDQLDAYNEKEQTASLKGKTAPVARNYKADFLRLLNRW